MARSALDTISAPAETLIGIDWGEVGKNALGGVHAAGTVVLSLFGLGEVAEKIEQAEADAGLLPDWARISTVPEPKPNAEPNAETRPNTDPVIDIAPAPIAPPAKPPELNAATKHKLRLLQQRIDRAKQRTVSGLDAVGAERVIMVRVKNATGLAQAQGGVAGLASRVAPGFVANKVNEEIASKLSESLRANKVDADVTVVDAKDGRVHYTPPKPTGDVAAPAEGDVFADVEVTLERVAEQAKAYRGGLIAGATGMVALALGWHFLGGKR